MNNKSFVMFEKRISDKYWLEPGRLVSDESPMKPEKYNICWWNRRKCKLGEEHCDGYV